MANHHETAKRALAGGFWKFLWPSSYRATHRIWSVRALSSPKFEDYDLIILDRDCFLHEYHADKRVLKFESTLRAISPRAEIQSNSDFTEFQRLGSIFQGVLPASKLVRLKGREELTLLRRDGPLHTFDYFPDEDVAVHNPELCLQYQGSLRHHIAEEISKPDPRTIRAIIATNIAMGRIPENPRVLMGGDRYLTDIIAGNLAGVDTAKGFPYKPFSDPWDLQAVRVLDVLAGGVIMRTALPIRDAGVYFGGPYVQLARRAIEVVRR